MIVIISELKSEPFSSKTHQLVCAIERIENKTDKRGKPYVIMDVCDKTGSIQSVKLFENTVELLNEKNIHLLSVVMVSIEKDEYKGTESYKIKTIEFKDLPLMDYIEPKMAPISLLELKKYIRDTIDDISHKGLQTLVREILNQNKEKFSYYPAAKTNHHAFIGGLMYHIYSMLLIAKQSFAIYPNVDRDLLISGIILHDIGKLKELDSNELCIGTSYSEDGNKIGHLVRGAIWVEEMAIRLNKEHGEDFIPASIVTDLNHLLLSHHGKKEWGSVVEPQTLEAHILHGLDYLDAHARGFIDKMYND